MTPVEMSQACDKMIAERGHYPRNESVETFKEYLGEDWGPVFHEYYTTNPESKLRVKYGGQMVIQVFENIIKDHQPSP